MDWDFGKAFLIKDINRLFEELGERSEEYTFLIDDNGGDTDGQSYLIDIDDVEKEDREIFEKYCEKVNAIVVYEYDAEFRDFLITLIPDFYERTQWWGSQAMGKAIFVVK